jgi:uncharacterized DUF497 family protein
MEFEWDPGKAGENLRKYRVSFNEAATAFGDLLGTTYEETQNAGANETRASSGLLLRHRVSLLEQRNEVHNQIRDLFETASVKLSSVVSDLLGVSGRRIIEA